MRLFGLRFFTRRSIRGSGVAAVAMAIALAGCASPGGGGLFARSADEDLDYQPEYFLKQAYCPPVEIRLGAEAHRIYERGADGDGSRLRFQATVNRTARECSAVGGTTSVKLGVAGSVVAGPKGGADTVELPLRVAVIRQSDNAVLFSELYRLPVSVAAPSFRAEFNQVFDQVAFPAGPQDRDTIVYVGFDANA